MSNAWKLFCAGISPLAAGYIFNFLLLYLPLPGILFSFLQLALLLAWGYLAFQLSNPEKSLIVQAFLLAAFGLLMLALVLYQELRLGYYWGNFIGWGPQLFFLPFLTLAASVVSPFMEVIRIWPMYLVVWGCLFLSGCAGCFLKRRKSF